MNKQPRFSVTAVILLVAVAFSAGALLAGKGFTRLNLASRSDTRPFSHTIVAGETVYIAGTLGIDPKTSRVPDDPVEEARLMLDGMKAKVELAGLTMDDLVSVQVFCSDISLYGKFNELYGSYFSKGKYPVRAFIGSGELLAGARFEINGIAVKQ